MKAVFTYRDSAQISEDSFKTFQQVIHVNPNKTIAELVEKHFPEKVAHGYPVHVELVVDNEKKTTDTTGVDHAESE